MSLVVPRAVSRTPSDAVTSVQRIVATDEERGSTSNSESELHSLSSSVGSHPAGSPSIISVVRGLAVQQVERQQTTEALQNFWNQLATGATPHNNRLSDYQARISAAVDNARLMAAERTGVSFKLN